MTLNATEQAAAADFAKALYVTDLAGASKTAALATLKSKIEKYPEDWIAGYPVTFKLGDQQVTRKVVLRKRNFWSLEEVPEVTLD